MASACWMASSVTAASLALSTCREHAQACLSSCNMRRTGFTSWNTALPYVMLHGCGGVNSRHDVSAPCQHSLSTDSLQFATSGHCQAFSQPATGPSRRWALLCSLAGWLHCAVLPPLLPEESYNGTSCAHRSQGLEALSPNVYVTRSRDLAPWVLDLVTALQAVRQIEVILPCSFSNWLTISAPRKVPRRWRGRNSGRSRPRSKGPLVRAG